MGRPVTRICWPAREEDLGPPVVAWLTAWGWDVYQEVVVGDGVADIVATRGPVVWIIELKLSFSLSLLDQAYHRRRYAHRVSVAVPKYSRGGSVKLGSTRHICDILGIGLLLVAGAGAEHVDERWAGRFVRARRLAVMSAMADAPGGRATSAQIRAVAAESAGDRAESWYWPSCDLSHLKWFKLVYKPEHRMWALTSRGELALASARAVAGRG